MHKHAFKMMCAATVAFSATLPAMAQDKAGNASGALLEEIIVTAQRRSEAVQDVPIAISAFSAAELERRQVTETLDLVNTVPNLIGANNTGVGTANQYYLRGLGNTESIATFDPPVGTYVDDIYVSRQNANNFGFFDVERIEVLRGPQGTLFGRNTTGGAVNVIMAKPKDTLGGFVELGYGKYDEKTARASIDVPVSETVLTKLSAFKLKNDGWAKNLTTGEDNNAEDSTGLRGAVRWLVSDNVTWDISSDYIKSKNDSLLNTIEGGDRVTRTGISRTGGAFVGIFKGDKQNWGLGNMTRTWTLTSNIQVETEGPTINIISGYRDLHQEYLLDFANMAKTTGGYVIAHEGDNDQFSQEVKANGSLFADKLDYVVGAYFLYEDNYSDFADYLNYTTPTVTADRTLKNTAMAKAVYSQFDFHATDKLTATAGIRFTEEKKEINIYPNGNPRTASKFSVADMAALGIPTDLVSTVWTPRFAVDYKIDEDVMLFASATRGFKSGGWNARGTGAELMQAFAPEKVWSYETGVRSEWMGGRLRANLNAFYTDVSDFQIPSAFQQANGAIAFITGNYADMEVKGLEAEFTFVPVAGLHLNAALGLQDSKYKSPAASVLTQQAQCKSGITARCGQGIVTPTGEIAEPVRSPDVTVNLSASYDFDIGAYVLTPSASLTHVGKHWVQTSNLPVTYENGYTVYSGGLTFGPTDGPWSASIDCSNCTNVAYKTSYLISTYYNRPVTWNARLKYKF